MTLLQALLAFTLAAGLLTITPGVDTLMVLRTVTTEGVRNAIFAALGIGAGCLAWGIAVAAGVAALLATEPMLFLAVKWAGAAYLAWIGIGLLLRPRDGLAIDADKTMQTRGGGLLWFRRGFVNNLLNPKMGVFYLSFLPQFVPAGYQPTGFVFLLACLHVLLGLLWLGTLIAASLPLGRLLQRPRFVRRLDRLCGGLFVAMGAKIALSR